MTPVEPAASASPATALETPTEGAARPKSAAAERALAEAEERRRRAEEARPREIGGRGGLEPARYGDWEVKGLASDF
jgi:hypothetical protein